MTKTKLLLLPLLGFLSLAGSPNPNRVLDQEKARSRVEFLSVGTPGAIKIRGKASEENIQPNA